MRNILCLLIFCLCLPVMHAEADEKKQLGPHMGQKPPLTIAVFGDSLVAGYGLPPDDAMPAQLEAKLRADGQNVRILNDGISGDTTAGGRTRIRAVLSQKPQVVVILFGGNDLLRALPVATARDNLDAMMSAFQKEGIKIFLLGMKAPLSLGPAYSTPFNAMYAELAAKYSAAFYPVYFAGVYGDENLMQADGIHPNREGVAAIVTKIEPQLLTLIKP